MLYSSIDRLTEQTQQYYYMYGGTTYRHQKVKRIYESIVEKYTLNFIDYFITHIYHMIVYIK